MAVAYSDKPIVFTTLDTSTMNGLIAEIDAALTAAGWTVKTIISAGFIYTLTAPHTPSNYQVKVLIQNSIQYLIDNPTADLYTGESVVLQLMSVSGGNKGFPHQLLPHNGHSTVTELQIVAGAYQMFISWPGHPGGAWSSFACGIPYVPPNTGACAVGSPAIVVTEIWWANGGSQFPYDWRTQANCYACSEYNINGVTTTQADNSNILPANGLLCLFPLTAVNTYNVAQISWPTITYSSHNVLNIDAFMGFQFWIRGQIWDAYLQTAAQTLDALVTAFDIDASGNTFSVESITWHSDFFSSLQLIIAIGGGFGNVAY
jgi:hypothetical protein